MQKGQDSQDIVTGGAGMDIVRIAALGIVGALLGILLKGQKKEYELFVTLGVSLQAGTGAGSD